MPKMIQIRNVPDSIHRVLKARAAEAGMTLSDFLLDEVRQTAERPTLDEILIRIKARGERVRPFDSARAVRAERDDTK